MTGVEALARWRHPTLGPLGADPLFAAAERADLGLALSDHIQQIALQRAARWPLAMSHLRLSINITAADVARAGFARLFLERVASSGFSIDRLTAEITETGLIRELDRAAVVLDSLRQAGVRIAIDDFGTGYSSLAYLTSLPIDYLKLDRALVSEVDASRRDRVVVRGIIRIAAHLGMSIVAEGSRRMTRRCCSDGWVVKSIRDSCVPPHSTMRRCGR
ncbi:EAL domain-containing protein [Sphingomonas sp. I4]